MKSLLSPLVRRLAWLVALMFGFFAASALAQQDDPPGRVAHLSQREGSVVFAPDGEDEWLDLPANRPLTRGDRLWTDRGARAELHLGSATVHLDGESHLALFELDHDAAQLSLTQGSLNARVRELQARENFEVDTPNIAMRARQPGDYRVDVDPQRQVTRVTVRSGVATVYGERGESVQLAAGQQAVFAGRDLEQVRGFFGGMDDFGQWAAERNRLEDQSISARYVPREVIGYSQLDHYGNWGQHADYGAVWYPRVTVSDWAPYRYGRWTYVRPWGWTWMDDAPWGFAPFHYGRWAVIGGRWAWVPGHFGPRPVYSPALVAFVGGGSGVSFSLTIGSSPGIAWYPLGPGEAWYPTYRYSPVYLRNVNRNIVINNIHVHVHRSRVNAVTAVRVEDFHRGRPVRERWQRVRAEDLRGAPVLRELPRPERDREAEQRDRRERPRLQAAPPPAAPVAPARVVRERQDDRDARRERPPVQQQVQPREQPERAERQQQQRAEREQERAEREQERRQRDAQRQQGEQREQAAQEQQRDRSAREQERAQRDQAVRQQQERLEREQERAQREAQRQQREQAQQQERAQREQERAQRDQAVRQQRERLEREQERAQREAQRQQREAQRQQQEQREQAVQQQQQRAQERAQREQERAQREQARPRPMPSGRANDDERRGNQRSQRGEEEDQRGRGGRGG